jgi:hypothetical protein
VGRRGCWWWMEAKDSAQCADAQKARVSNEVISTPQPRASSLAIKSPSRLSTRWGLEVIERLGIWSALQPTCAEEGLASTTQGENEDGSRLLAKACEIVFIYATHLGWSGMDVCCSTPTGRERARDPRTFRCRNVSKRDAKGKASASAIISISTLLSKCL